MVKTLNSFLFYIKRKNKIFTNWLKKMIIGIFLKIQGCFARRIEGNANEK